MTAPARIRLCRLVADGLLAAGCTKPHTHTAIVLEVLDRHPELLAEYVDDQRHDNDPDAA